jgi:hypothetical protein
MTAPPHEFTPEQLRRAGVRIISIEPLRLKCERCSAIWFVSHRGLRLPKGYWKCPNHCNIEL